MLTLEPTEQLKNHGSIFLSKFLPDDFCDKVVTTYEGNKYLSYSSGYGFNNTIDKSHVDCKAINLHSHEHTKKIANEIGGYFSRFINEIISEFPDYGKGLSQCIKSCEDVRLKKYEEGVGHFDWHTDNSTPELKTRSISVLAYFNTPEEGGETQFKIQDVEVKPEKGVIVAFPPNWDYPHRSALVKKGNKYSSNIFFHM